MGAFKKLLRPVKAHIKAQKKSTGGVSATTNPGKVSARRPAGVSAQSTLKRTAKVAVKQVKAQKRAKQTKGGFKPGFTTKRRKR